MPELPEVETVARSLTPYLTSATITSALLLRASSLHPLSLPIESLIGTQIQAIRRRGKLLIMDLASAPVLSPASPSMLIAHLRMTGRFLTAPANMELGRHTRCVFGLQGKDGSVSQLFFDDIRSFGQLLSANDAILEKWSFWRDLGPEPLLMENSALYGRLRGKRPIKTTLLDQKVIAGIGNIYADESLFLAGINPERPADSLSEPESEKLLAAVKKILKSAIENRGSSIRDYRDADGNAGAFQNKFHVYQRGGKSCKNCGRILTKIKISGRSTVYCGSCQK